MAGATLTVDNRQMQDALRQYAARTKHSMAYVLNKKLFFIAKRAYEGTPVAKRERILETFNVTQIERVVGRGRFAGKVRRKTNYSGLNQSAFRIMNWKRKKAGKPTLRGAEALRAAKAMVASRLRAVGSLKSGWVGGIIRLQRWLKEPFQAAFRNRLNRPGTAEPAKAGTNPVAEIAYRLTIRKRASERIDPRVIAALQRAFNEEASDTMLFLNQELQKEANKINAK